MTAHDAHIRPGHDLIAVFRTKAEAVDAGMALVGAGAAAEEDVVVGETGDRESVLTAEMQTEIGRSPLWRALMTRHGSLPSVLVMGITGWIASAAIAFALALIDFGPDGYWERFVIAFVVVVTMGTMVSLLAIGGIATASTDAPLASERGVTLHVHHASDASCEMLLQMNPLRVDEMGARGQPAAGIHVEAGRSITPGGRHDQGWG